MSEGCWEALPDLPNCASARGGVFTRNLSTSWSTNRLPNGGLAQLNTFEEGYLGANFTGAAYYGFDTVRIGMVGQSLPLLPGQLVAGIATDNYFVGSLGLSPISFNISDLNGPVPSLLAVLRNDSVVPSTSWAYTAGAYYREPQVYGSLTLGGYDDTRLGNALRNIPFSGDTSRDIQVNLQTITYDTIGSTPLMTESISVFIDSFISQIWLPAAVCERFEQAFNLTWDPSAQLYLVDEGTHTALEQQNPTFTFRIGTSNTSAGTVDIVLPYAAFDLNTSQPLGSARYFPLQRAQNSTQYILGRTFLQEAYLIADYDRQNFTLAQANQPSSSVPEQLVPICTPDDEAPCRGAHHGKVSGGGIAGLAVGATALVLGSFAAALLWYRRKRRSRAQSVAPPRTPDTHDMSDARPAVAVPLLPKSAAEMESREAALYEMDPRAEFRPELDGHNKPGLQVKYAEHEMATPDVAAYELDAAPPGR